ncbi:outer membrane protein [Acetobacter oeni LMG 21952]|nr:outer membrane protein [Acetobacter oeni LMG 21952]
MANGDSYGQISSLSIGDYATLKVTATTDSSDSGYVFSTYAMEIAPTGQLIIDTSSPVELGMYTENRGGTITIIDNPGNVVLDGNRLSGDGQLNLVNSTLGSAETPISVPDMNVTLQGGSTFYAGWYASGASVTFDPATSNTLVLQGTESTITTPVYGVSENSHFAINGDDGVTPVSAAFSENSNGTYSLVISMSNGNALTLSDVTVASGFVPGTASISQDAAGDYIITDLNAASTTTDYTTSATHEQLQQVATAAEQAGGDTSQYTTTGYVNHTSVANDHFTGTGTATSPAEWSNASNWELGAVPQSDSCYQGTLQGTADDPLYVVYDQANAQQFVSLSVLSNATLTITAPAGINPDSYVFSTAGVEVRDNGQLIIDTAARVELGGVSAIDGTLTIENNDGNVVVDSDHLSGSGTLTLDNSTFGTPASSIEVDLPTINLNDNSTLYTALYGNTSTINFDNSHNTIVLSGNSTDVETVFNNVSANTQFAIDADVGASPVSAVYTENSNGSYTLTIGLSNGTTDVLSHVNLAAGFVPGTASFTQDAYGDWLITTASSDACFLAGSLIRTDRGDVAVEDLVAGDQLVVANAGETLRPVVWTGYCDTAVNPTLPDSEAGYPVRILKDAIAENVPSRDLLVTAEHCLFADGGFVPVRMLVNGASIFYDRSITEYRYFHIETAQHSVIVANNTPTESYLDTGHRRTFSSGAVVSLVSRHLNWADDAAAPLLTQRDQVEPIFQRIVARATGVLSLAMPGRPATTRKADLRFETLQGTALRRFNEKDGVFTLELPENISQIRILSRASRPADVVGPFLDDRRRLGVLVSDVTLLDGGAHRAIRSHLDGSTTVGWHGIEGNMRWTAGDAVLDLGTRTPGKKNLLTIHIVAAGPYIIETSEEPVRLCA